MQPASTVDIAAARRRCCYPPARSSLPHRSITRRRRRGPKKKHYRDSGHRSERAGGACATHANGTGFKSRQAGDSSRGRPLSRARESVGGCLSPPHPTEALPFAVVPGRAVSPKRTVHIDAGRGALCSVHSTARSEILRAERCLSAALLVKNGKGEGHCLGCRRCWEKSTEPPTVPILACTTRQLLDREPCRHSLVGPKVQTPTSGC
jgi:hypothetical protein